MDNDEKELFSAAADALIFDKFRKSTVRLIVTEKRVLVTKLISFDEYPFEDIVKIERFKALFMNIGIKFYLSNGKTVSLATRQIKKLEEALLELGKEVLHK